MNKPAAFIGSSTEGLEFARAIRSLLTKDVEISLWNEDIFHLTNTFIESLIAALPRFDFAILVLTPDDLVSSRGATSLGPRDNVIFELGLFMGHLGRSRTFIIHQSNTDIKLPTDLLAVTNATYEWPRIDESYISAVGAACDAIRRIIHDLGVSEKKTNKEVSNIKTRQENAEKRIKDAEANITTLFAYTMSVSMFSNLKKLSTGNFGHFINNGGLRRELRHLRDIGYITSVGHIGHLPEEGNNLSEFIKITPVGKKFVEFRSNMEKSED
ncbi:MAG TPA: nucleotide-binding protein [Flavisolibacter sp.]|nr:nucleotide-binding protein [Flavisolibacter sp.]